MQKSVGGSKGCGARRWMRVALRWSLTLSKVAEGIVPRVNLSMLRAHSASAPRSRDLVLVLSGPTATGKSAVAVEIARRLGGEIVSADSVQLYKGLDIGSGKITRSEMRGIPHHCIDVFDASDDVGANNAVGFSALARSCIDDILSRGAVPIIVGGSGMYLSFLLYGPPPTNPPPPSDVQAPAMQLSPSDDSSRSLSPSRLPHSNDAYRIKRRREIESTSGSVPAYAGLMADRHLLPLDYNFLCISMWCDRVQSFRRIDRRVEQMVCDGLLVEVLQLYGNGCLRPTSMAARAIGYRQALCFLAEYQHVLLGDDWLQEYDHSSVGEHQCKKSRLAPNAAMHDALMLFVDRMQAATRQYSTRQLTWFKGDKRWLWFDTQPLDCKIDVEACAERLSSALALNSPSKSSDFSPTIPPLTKAEVNSHHDSDFSPYLTASQASILKRYATVPSQVLLPAVRQRLLLQARQELLRVNIPIVLRPREFITLTHRVQIMPLLDGAIQAPD